MSGKVCIGDKVYLNPQNIATRIVSVRSETRELSSARAGGCKVEQSRPNVCSCK